MHAERARDFIRSEQDGVVLSMKDDREPSDPSPNGGTADFAARSEYGVVRRSAISGGGPRHASSSFGATLMRTTYPGTIEADSGIRLPDDIRFRVQASSRALGAGGSEREARKEAG